MENLSELKLELIGQIMLIDEPEKVEQLLDDVTGQKRYSRVPNFHDAVTEIRKGVTLEELLTEQNYRPGAFDVFRTEVDDIEWGMSLEEMLALT